MKKLFIKALPVVSLGFLLGACSKEVNVNYFLEHPRALQKQLQTCIANQADTDVKFVQNCKMAAEAETILRGYLQAEQSDPEKFGEGILTAQYDLSLLTQKITDTQMVLTQATDEQKKIALNKALEDLKKSQTEKEQQIKVLLAVAGLNSPE